MSARPYLRGICLKREEVHSYDAYPFSIPAVRELHRIEFHRDVTFFIGDNGCGKSLYILDEPEAALSPARQLAVLRRMHQFVSDDSQFIIATHSPILMAYPSAKILLLDGAGFNEVRYEETEHYAVTREFLANPS